MRTVLLLVLVPALAVAAPKPKKAPKPPKKEKKQPVEPEPAPAPDPVRAPAPADDAKNPPATPNGGGGAGAGSGSASGGGEAVAEPKEPKKNDKSDKASSVDVDTLRQEYLALRDELFKSRARANAVASQLYSTRVQVKLTYTTARYYNPAKATIRLDGASIYENATGAIGTDDGVRFDGYIAPGRHLITFRVEATGKDDESFTSVTETQIVVKAIAGKDLVVAAKAKDGGDIAYEWKKKERGTYGLGIDVSVKTLARAVESRDKSGDRRTRSSAEGDAKLIEKPAKAAKK